MQILADLPHAGLIVVHSHDACRKTRHSQPLQRWQQVQRLQKLAGSVRPEADVSAVAWRAELERCRAECPLTPKKLLGLPFLRTAAASRAAEGRGKDPR